MKLKHLKVANAVKAGTREEMFLTDEKFEMTLEQGVIIRIKDKKTGRIVNTTLMNTIWWEEDDGEEAKPVAKKIAKKDDAGAFI